MKKKFQKFWREVENELKENRTTFLVYTGLRILVIATLVLQLFNRNYENVFLCILTLFLMILPSAVQATFKVSFPTPLEIIMLCFIFAAEILGEISSFYMRFQYWDTILHTLNGFICAGIGFSLVDIMNKQKKYKFEMSPAFLAITAFCFSMTIGVLWEFFEYSMDSLWNLDMQKDTIITEIYSTIPQVLGNGKNITITDIKEVVIDGQVLDVGGYLDIGLIDTMNDLIVNFIGASVFSALGYLCIKRKDMKHVILGLIPESKESKGTASGQEKE